MHSECKPYIIELEGFLNAISIIKSPTRNYFYGARLFENKSLLSEADVMSVLGGEIEGVQTTLLSQKKRDVDLHWLYSEIEAELSDVDDKIRQRLVDNVIYYFEVLFDETPPTAVIEYRTAVKLSDREIDFYSEFEDKHFLFQVEKDVIRLSFSTRTLPVQSLSERLSSSCS